MAKPMRINLVTTEVLTLPELMLILKLLLTAASSQQWLEEWYCCRSRFRNILQFCILICTVITFQACPTPPPNSCSRVQHIMANRENRKVELLQFSPSNSSHFHFNLRKQQSEKKIENKLKKKRRYNFCQYVPSS